MDVNDSNFEENVIKKSEEVPVVVDFWSSWCPPCLILAPILDKIAEEYKGKFILAKINVDENPLTSQKYKVMSIPNVKMFKNGNIVDEFIGNIPKQAVKDFIDKNLR